MNSLWIVNKPCGAMHEKLFGKKSTGGLWLEAMLSEAEKTGDKITVVNISTNVKINKLIDGNIIYYTLPGSPDYNYNSESNIKLWKEIANEEKPDCVIAWGCEFSYVLSLMKAKENIPVLLYVQGILKSIYKYYTAGLDKTELKKSLTLRDVFKKETISQTKYRYEKKCEYEKEIVSKVSGVLVENKWAETYFKSINPNVSIYKSNIPITQIFFEKNWQAEIMQPRTLMCSAADYPIKGLHILLKALCLVKKKYQDVRLFVPGAVLKKGTDIKSRCFQRGYDRLIETMINEMDLNKNVIYTGRLTAEEMAEKMSSVNCFVMCSAVENHSSTLKEAMSVGVPCISSYVGGVPEYAQHNINSLLYRFEDYEMLAEHIITLFKNEDICKILSENAKKYMIDYNKTNSELYKELKDVLEKIIAENE